MVKKIGKYEILSKIGVGSMGSVYKAIDPLIQRQVAIKTIKAELLSSTGDSDILKRFQQEARAIGQLHHPNIVAVFEYGEDHGKYFIAMTYAEGRDLKEYFDKQEKFSMDSILKIMEQLLDALAFSHKHNIYHRDIKPANIIVQQDGSIMVTDFGIARLESSDLTQAGAVMGTPSYMSPEQLIGQRVDGRTDIFSAGVVFYQFLTGEKPFTGSTIASIMHKIVNVNPVPPSHIDVTLPSFLDEIVFKSLAKKRADRYASADEFKRDIQSAIARIKDDSLEHVDDATRVLPVRSGPTPELDSNATRFLATSGTTQTQIPLETQQDELKQVRSTIPWKIIIPAGAIILLLFIVIIAVSLTGKDEEVAPVVDAKTAITEQEDLKAPEKVAVVQMTKINITTSPEGAMVFLDGQEMTDRTPLQLELEKRQYLLGIQKEGYHELAIILKVKADKDMNFNLNMHSL